MSTTLTIIAIIAGPILAVQAQKIIELIKQRRDEKRRLFMTLMATRGRPLLPEHVQALNMIDITFTVKGIIASIIFWRSKKDKAVIDAWSELRAHLYAPPQRPSSKEGTDNYNKEMSAYNVQMQLWSSKKGELLIELLAKMASSLGYRYSKLLLEKGSYTPQHYGDLETFQIINLAGLSEIIVGNKSLPVHIVNIPSAEKKEVPQNVLPEEPKQDSQ